MSVHSDSKSLHILYGYSIFNKTPLIANHNRITITPQDSTQINSPQLIENLDNGLYVIDKNFNDGSTKQQVVEKQNN